MPLDMRIAKVIFQRDSFAYGSMIEVELHANHLFYETEDFGVGLAQIPIEPTNVVV
jgi:hypothetical protein